MLAFPIETKTTKEYCFLKKSAYLCSRIEHGAELSLIASVLTCLFVFQLLHTHINLLTPNVNYSDRTAPLTSKVAFYIFIQQI